MKRLDKQDLSLIRSHAKIEIEIKKGEEIAPYVKWGKIRTLLRQSFPYNFVDSKIEIHCFTSLDEIENFLVSKDRPLSLLYDEEKKLYHRYYAIGENKEGEEKEEFFEIAKSHSLIINRPFTIVRSDGVTVDVVHMNANTIKLSSNEYEIYKELFAD